MPYQEYNNIVAIAVCATEDIEVFAFHMEQLRQRLHLIPNLKIADFTNWPIISLRKSDVFRSYGVICLNKLSGLVGRAASRNFQSTAS